MRDAYHEELARPHRRPRRDEPAGRLGDQPGLDSAAGRRPHPRRERDPRRRRGRRAARRPRPAGDGPAGPAAAGRQRPAHDRDLAEDERRPGADGRPGPARGARRPAALPRVGGARAVARHHRRDGPGRRAAGRQGRRGDRTARRRRAPPRSSATTTRWTACTASCSPRCSTSVEAYGVEAAIDVTPGQPLLRAVRRPRRRGVAPGGLPRHRPAAAQWSPSRSDPPSRTAREPVVYCSHRGPARAERLRHARCLPAAAGTGPLSGPGS